jgi:hypothetical protein
MSEQIINVQVAAPDAGAMHTSAITYLDTVRSLEIKDQPTYDRASRGLVAIKTKWKELDEIRRAIVKPLDEARKNVQALFNPALQTLETAETEIKGAMTRFLEEEQRRAAEAQRAAEEAARKERARLAQEAAAAEAAAREKAAAERQAAEDARKALELAQRQGRAEDAMEMAEQAAMAEVRAEQAEQAGQAQAAELATLAGLTVAAPVVAAPTKAKGQSVRRVWKGRITNKAAFVRACAENPQWLALVDVNEAALNQLAKALQENLSIPGVEAYSDAVLAARVA